MNFLFVVPRFANKGEYYPFPLIKIEINNLLK